MTQAKQFKMPDVGEGLTEADIITWRVQIGDTVAINDIIVEVETAKAVVELPSPFAGVVSAIHYQDGQTVDVGAVIIDFDGGSEGDPPTPKAAMEHEVPTQTGDASPDDERHEVLVGYGPTRSKITRRPRRAERVVSIPPTEVNVSLAVAKNRSTPFVRKLARDLGVDMSVLTGTGPDGKITREDIFTVSRATGPVHVAVEPTGTEVGGEVRIPIKGVRKVTADAMVASAFTAPHVTEWVTVDVTRTVKYVKRLRAHPDFADVRLSPLIVVAKAALLALTRYPAINAKWDAVANEIVQYEDVNLGIAAATPRGLLVPNIRAAQRLSIGGLANSVTELVREAREGKTPLERMKGGTFTITNIGVFGIDGGTPILNPGESAILCLGQIRRQPWEHKGRIKLRNVCTLALSFDHRLVDGELGSRVLADIAATLRDPAFSPSLVNSESGQ